MLRQVAGLGSNFLPLSVAEWLAYWAAVLVAWVQDTMIVDQMMQNCFPMSRQKLATSKLNQLIVHAVLQQTKMGITVSMI